MPAILRGLTRFAWLRRATSATEFAFIAPVLLVLVGGVVEFGRIFVVYNATNRIASQYAIAWADCTDTPLGTCGTELGNYTSANAIANIAPQLTAASLTLTMFQVTMVGPLPVVVYSYPTAATLTAAQTTLAQSTFSSGQSGIIVTASYSHSLVFFRSLMTPFLGSYLTPAYTVAQLKS